MSKEELPQKILKIKESCKVAARILDELVSFTKMGMTTYEVDQQAKLLCEKYKVRSMTKNYGTRIMGKPFPGYICIGINDVVTHGIGSDEIIKEGDLVSIDVVIKKDEYCGDTARSFTVGKQSKRAKQILKNTTEALNRAIKAAKTGATTGDIGYAIQSYVESKNYNVVRELVGHTIGKKMHEDPMIPGWGTPNTGPILERFHTIAMDTLVTEGSPEIEISKKDGWTARTKDGKLACLMEHTFYVDNMGGVILTNS